MRKSADNLDNYSSGSSLTSRSYISASVHSSEGRALSGNGRQGKVISSQAAAMIASGVTTANSLQTHFTGGGGGGVGGGLSTPHRDSEGSRRDGTDNDPPTEKSLNEIKRLIRDRSGSSTASLRSRVSVNPMSVGIDSFNRKPSTASASIGSGSARDGAALLQDRQMDTSRKSTGSIGAASSQVSGSNKSTPTLGTLNTRGMMVSQRSGASLSSKPGVYSNSKS